MRFKVNFFRQLAWLSLGFLVRFCQVSRFVSVLVAPPPNFTWSNGEMRMDYGWLEHSLSTEPDSPSSPVGRIVSCITDDQRSRLVCHSAFTFDGSWALYLSLFV